MVPSSGERFADLVLDPVAGDRALREDQQHLVADPNGKTREIAAYINCLTNNVRWLADLGDDLLIECWGGIERTAVRRGVPLEEVRRVIAEARSEE